uniref:Secreted protein n=1 Tax=Gongylonema pulchrum TaxID=637853 RepID=A0A183D8E5_9BILA
LLHLAVTSSLTSWAYALCRFKRSFQNTLLKSDQWFDLCMCKSLSEATELRDDLILSVCPSTLHEVKRYATVMNACASCKLMLFLFRCSMQKEEAKRQNYWKEWPAMLERRISSRSIRKLALTATLNAWQELMAPHIKVCI